MLGQMWIHIPKVQKRRASVKEEARLASGRERRKPILQSRQEVMKAPTGGSGCGEKETDFFRLTREKINRIW